MNTLSFPLTCRSSARTWTKGIAPFLKPSGAGGRKGAIHYHLAGKRRKEKENAFPSTGTEVPSDVTSARPKR